MRNNHFYSITLIVFLMVPSITANEFIVPKKTKTKKESATQIKEDVAELLESGLRQLGTNIQQSATVQNCIFDKIKELLLDNQQSVAQLKELREKLEKYLKRFEEQQADLYSFLLDFK